MGGNGQPAGHGARQLIPRARRQTRPAQPQPQAQPAPKPAPKPKTKASEDINALQALAKKSGSAADQKLADIIRRVTNEKIDPNQQDTDTQRFINAIGWADKKPVVVADEAALEAEKFKGTVSGQYFYHTDMPFGAVNDAKTFAEQFMGKGRQFLSAGIHGDGTYFSNDEYDSWRYNFGNQMGYQIKGMLNKNAKPITETRLAKMIDKFQREHPQAFAAINAYTTGKNRPNYLRGQFSVFAALFGYNVIQSVQMGHDYLTILDRSAMTVVKAGQHYGTRKGWLFT